MKNNIFLFVLLFFSIGKSFSQETDYSTIHFIAGRGIYGININYSLYINERLVVNANSLEEINIKYFSKGLTSITIVGAGKVGVSLNINENKDYYIFYKLTSGLVEGNIAEYKKYSNVKKRSMDISENEFVGKTIEGLPAPRGGKGQGTCFAISPNGYLVTNYHCIENAKDITVKGIDGDLTTKYGATVVASDPSNDLAILKISNKNVKFNAPNFGFRSSGVAQAEKVYALGFPSAAAMGTEVKITEGIISAKSGVGGDISKFQISAAVNPGNSGGPLIDEQGNLIGVIFAKSTIAESAGYAIKASYLETFLKNVDGFEFPAFVNSMKDKPFTEKVADWKNYIFIVETN